MTEHIKACLSSKTNDWSTPQNFFDKLNDEFHLTLVQTKQTTNVSGFTLVSRTGLNRLGRAMSFAILHMAEKLASGCVKHTKKREKVQRWLC